MSSLVLVNRRADFGRAWRKWQRVAGRLRPLLGEAPSVHDDRVPWRPLVERAAREGRRLVVAAGGDGTVQRVGDLLLSLPGPPCDRPVLGALGLGSGNDFHKPFDPARRVGGLPARCCVAGAAGQNVLRVEYLDPGGVWRSRHAVTSCSMGVVALGNHLLNRRRGLVGLCRRWSVEAGIWCASVVSPILQRGIQMRVTVDGRDAYDGAVCLLGVCVNRHFVGSLAYAGSTDVAGPALGVTLLPDVGVPRRLRLLARAARSTLPGEPDARVYEARSCDVVCRTPTALEMDGEVVTAARMRVHLLRHALRVCG